MIKLIDINKYFTPSVHAIKDLSLDVHGGETLVLLESSRCGKTTVLKMINRIIEPSSGTVLIDGGKHPRTIKLSVVVLDFIDNP